MLHRSLQEKAYHIVTKVYELVPSGLPYGNISVLSEPATIHIRGPIYISLLTQAKIKFPRSLFHCVAALLMIEAFSSFAGSSEFCLLGPIIMSYLRLMQRGIAIIVNLKSEVLRT